MRAYSKCCWVRAVGRMPAKPYAYSTISPIPGAKLYDPLVLDGFDCAQSPAPITVVLQLADTAYRLTTLFWVIFAVTVPVPLLSVTRTKAGHIAA